MMIGSKSVLHALALGAMVVLLAMGSASADLKVSGGVFAISAVPLQHVEYVITVSNGDVDRAVDLNAQVAGFGQAPDGSDIVQNASTDTSPYTARPFLTVTPTSFHLEPGQSQRLVLMGDIPEGIGDGGRYALVNIHSNALSSLVPENNTPIAVSIDVPVLITIYGSNLENKAEISRVDLGTPASTGARSVAVLLTNTGNYHYKALAKSVLANATTNEVLGFATTSLSSSLIIPTTTRLFQMQLKPGSSLTHGQYVITSTVSLADGTVLARRDTTFTA
jgi:hypothetical protein